MQGSKNWSNDKSNYSLSWTLALRTRCVDWLQQGIQSADDAQKAAAISRPIVEELVDSARMRASVATSLEKNRADLARIDSLVRRLELRTKLEAAEVSQVDEQDATNAAHLLAEVEDRLSGDGTSLVEKLDDRRILEQVLVPQPIPMPGATIENSVGMKLAFIPPGEFLRGSSESDEWGQAAEEPRHRVRITQGFRMATTEVTQGQWKAVMGTEPWIGEALVPQGINYPATVMTWLEATAFCKELSEKEGKTYRLPTEAEWEYSCRAGTSTRFFFGDDVAQFGEYAWLGEKGQLHVVAQKKPNAWGLYDMHGNAWEMCQDWYDEQEYGRLSGQVAIDPLGPMSSPESKRIIRGGGHTGDVMYCRSAFRGRTVEGGATDGGFRVVSEGK